MENLLSKMVGITERQIISIRINIITPIANPIQIRL